MSESDQEGIKVRICDTYGYYLTDTEGSLDFSRNKHNARIFDYHQDHVVDLVIHAARKLETQWFLDPVDEQLRGELCEKCGSLKAVTDTIFSGSAYHCRKCSPHAE